jgi:hypothetical protein
MVWTYRYERLRRTCCPSFRILERQPAQNKVQWQAIMFHKSILLVTKLLIATDTLHHGINTVSKIYPVLALPSHLSTQESQKIHFQHRRTHYINSSGNLQLHARSEPFFSVIGDTDITFAKHTILNDLFVTYPENLYILPYSYWY